LVSSTYWYEPRRGAGTGIFRDECDVSLNCRRDATLLSSLLHLVYLDIQISRVPLTSPRVIAEFLAAVSRPAYGAPTHIIEHAIATTSCENFGRSKRLPQSCRYSKTLLSIHTPQCARAVASRLVIGYPARGWRDIDSGWYVPLSRHGVMEQCEICRKAEMLDAALRGLATSSPRS
jgi:hypothetical protein